MDNHVLSNAARRELLLDRARLVAERDGINAALANIDALLGRANGTKPKHTLRASLSLREAITAILEEHPNGLRPIEVTERLEANGYQPPGRTKLSLLVSGTLFRLHEVGVARRLPKSGAYRLVDVAPAETEGGGS